MKDTNRLLLRQLVAEEIRRTVADAAAGEDCLEAGRTAALIHKAYPECGMTPDDIRREILKAAISARVPVEIGPTGALAAPGQAA